MNTSLITEKVIRVVVADDHALFRQGLVALLSALSEFEIVGEAENGQEALVLAGRLAPDVVLMDLRMPVLDGVQATRRLRAELPSIHVVVLTTFDDDESIFESIRAGALGYLLKDVSSAALSEALRLAASGQSFLTPRVATRLVSRVANTSATRPQSGPSRLDVLTPRERQVLRLIARGAANKDIARHLDVAEGTVKNHVTSLLLKLGVNDRLQAALLARELEDEV